jgi:adenylate cyclase
VAPYSLPEVARRAGVDPGYVEDLIRLGVISPDPVGAFSSGDARRARMVQSLERAGLPLEGMGEAIRTGSLSLAFLDLASYDRFAGLSDSTFAELSERTGLPLELLTAVREAMGFAQPDPQDTVRDDELLVIPTIEFQMSRGFRPVVIERWLRVYGESLRRIAETESDWWHSEVEVPLLESGMPEGEMLAVTNELTPQFAPLIEQAVLAIYHGQQEHAWMRQIIDAVEGALAAAGLYSRMERPPAVCFLDITGYTRLTEERGDAAAADLAASLAHLVERVSRQRGGKAVKWLGDGVMFYFERPGEAPLAALEMVEGLAAQDLPPAHVGLHAGPVVFQEGDYFGRTVNMASRIADYARPGEVVVSDAVVRVAQSDEVAFADIGDVELKGASGTLHLFTARRLDDRS